MQCIPTHYLISWCLKTYNLCAYVTKQTACHSRAVLVLNMCQGKISERIIFERDLLVRQDTLTMFEKKSIGYVCKLHLELAIWADLALLNK